MKKIADIMTEDVITIDKDATVKEASQILTENNLNGAPVVSNGKMLGIISGVDLISRTNEKPVQNFMSFLDNVFYLEDYDEFEKDFEKILDTKIKEIMTQDVITLSPEDSVRRAANIFSEKRIKQIPITEGDKLVGMVELPDLIAVIGDRKEKEE